MPKATSLLIGGAGFKRLFGGVLVGDAVAIRAGALVLEAELKIELSQPGSGKVYGKHQASAPGEPPAVDFGTLRSDVQTDFLSGRFGGTVARVGFTLDKAPMLNYGTTRMAPRPFMDAALRRAKSRMGGDMKNAMAGFMGRNLLR